MTQDTPAPTAAADDGLNVEIAQLLGWEWYRYSGTLPSPHPEGREYAWLLPDYEGQKPNMALIEGEPDPSLIRVYGQKRCPVPKYDSDPSAALRLLAHVLALCDHNGYPRFECVIERTAMKGLWSVKFHGWADESRENPGAFADTLEMAVARACRDALAALREANGNGN